MKYKNLLAISTQNGASSLGLQNKIGSFELGKFMDFVAFDLESPRIKEFMRAEKLLDSIIFGCGNAEILLSGVSGIIRFKKHN